jgi:EcoEI R protein
VSSRTKVCSLRLIHEESRPAILLHVTRPQHDIPIKWLSGFASQFPGIPFSFLNGKKPTANQIEFINLMIDHLTQRGWMEPSLLYESPFTDINPRGVEGIFNDTEVTQLIGVLTSVREHAAV